ncbi:MAG: hypothetical protein LIP23_03855 [Planctomycetes bacterium]|nr:hypothetical protein [Planctomycetota bacterium]
MSTNDTAIERYVREKLREMETENDDSNENIEFDPQLEGLVNPKVYRKGKIVGDIIGPFPEEWGEHE